MSDTFDVRLAFALVALLAALGTVPAAARDCAGVVPIAGGSSRIAFDGWAGPDLAVELHRPNDAPAAAPIVFVMHGNGRDGDRYRDEWRALADEHGFVVVAPTFAREYFPGAAGYNLGNLFAEDRSRNPIGERSFAAIEPLFDRIACGLDGEAAGYAMYGHSAGGQFVHRYVAFAEAPRLTRAVAANAGWYTMPDPAAAFPYGWGGEAHGMVGPRAALARPLTVLLGTEDIERDDANLRRTAQADRQGQTRFARGHGFLDAARALATTLDVPLAWQIAYAPGIGHANGAMAEFAVPHLLGAGSALEAAPAPPPVDADALMARDDIAAAFAAIEALEREWAVERLVTLTQIPAPPFGEGPRAEAFARMLGEVGGLEVTSDAVGNVIGRREGTGGGSTVMLAAHLDTVFPIETDVTVRRQPDEGGERFTAPGIGDNSRGLVALLLVAEGMARASVQTKGDVLFVGTVGEEGEGNLRGMRHLFATPDHAVDAVIAIDGGEASRLVTAAVGSNRYRIRFSGPGGHSYGAFGTANPHHATARAITGFIERARHVAASGPKATYSVARLEGGIGINVIATHSVFEIDMRSADPDRLAALDAILRSAVAGALAAENDARAQGEALTVEIEDLGKRPAAANTADSTLVPAAIEALRALGVKAQLSASSTDANLPMSLGIASVTMSRGGRSYLAHALDEYWIAEQPHLGPQASLLVIALEAGLDPPL